MIKLATYSLLLSTLSLASLKHPVQPFFEGNKRRTPTKVITATTMSTITPTRGNNQGQYDTMSQQEFQQ